MATEKDVMNALEELGIELDNLFADVGIDVQKVDTVEGLLDERTGPRLTPQCDKSLYDHAYDFAEAVKAELTNLGIGGVAVTTANRPGGNVPEAITYVLSSTVAVAASFCRNYTTDRGRLSCYVAARPNPANVDTMYHWQINKTLTLMTVIARACATLPPNTDMSYHDHPPFEV